MVHRSVLDAIGMDTDYPSIANYCVLVRDLSSEAIHGEMPKLDSIQTKAYIERVVAEAVDAEYGAYMSLPDVRIDEIDKWFCSDGPARKEIINILERHKKKGWVISNPMNPSTKRLLIIRVKKIAEKEAVVNTTEYWYLKWWDLKEGSYAYPYRETNRQVYILRKESDTWKVFENLRPLPRSSVPHRWKRN
ncbi:MAG TPA: hypothetical protein DCR97_13935 [Deltaproteobacteria bacterium]|nr:hypothetical protein [Deltaproteobacteria bacterium]